MTMMVAVVAVMLGVCSCGSDDDDPVVALASQVVGSYTGNEIIMVMGEESSNRNTTYEITKASDSTVDMLIPESGEMGMVIPALTVKNIPLTDVGSSISGKLAKYEGTVKNAKGDEKAYTINNLTVLVNDKKAVVTFSLKYGNMPMAMETSFTGTKK